MHGFKHNHIQVLNSYQYSKGMIKSCVGDDVFSAQIREVTLCEESTESNYSMVDSVYTADGTVIMVLQRSLDRDG